MKIMQVFDSYDMPSEVKDAFFERTYGLGNDCYVRWSIGDFGYGDSEDAKTLLVDKWLTSQTSSLNSEVLISHSW